MLKAITKFIETKTSFKVGTDLFAGWRSQDAPDRCQLVSESGGGKPYFDLPDRVDKSIQIISRAKTYFTAQGDAREIFDAIHGTAGWTLPVVVAGSEYIAMTIEAVADPQFIQIDEKGRFEFSTNYIFRMRDKNA